MHRNQGTTRKPVAARLNTGGDPACEVHMFQALFPSRTPSSPVSQKTWKKQLKLGGKTQASVAINGRLLTQLCKCAPSVRWIVAKWEWRITPATAVRSDAADYRKMPLSWRRLTARRIYTWSYILMCIVTRQCVYCRTVRRVQVLFKHWDRPLRHSFVFVFFFFNVFV